MSKHRYDVIVVGARCAGSPTAMLLARKGYRVLLVDRATFPSDTLSTHVVHPPAVAALRRRGLLDRLVATGCPPIDTYSFDFGPVKLAGAPGTDDSPVAYCPRRTVLDKLLVDAASEAGAEVHEGFAVKELVFDRERVRGIRGHGTAGATVTETAAVVVGADGLYSRVAQSVRAQRYHDRPPLQGGYYAYWSGLPADHFEIHFRPHRGFALAPTHDGLTLVVVGWPIAEFDTFKHDVEDGVRRTFDLVPDVADRIRTAQRETRFAGTAVPNFFRKPYGPGWALVGDAGYNKDPITAMGILDAFRDAELCTNAVDAALSGVLSFDVAMREYQSVRDEHVKPMFDLTCELATLEPPPPEMQALLAAMQGNQDAMDGFVRVNAGVTSPAEFFSEENLAVTLAGTGELQASSTNR